jgi:AbrB family looped-hinge helix DNA binding protein
MYKAKITSKGQITLPVELRKALSVETGDSVMFVPEKNGEFRIRRAPRSILELEGCVPYSGPPVPVEEMKSAIGAYLAAQDERTMSPAARRRARRLRKKAA